MQCCENHAVKTEYIITMLTFYVSVLKFLSLCCFCKENENGFDMCAKTSTALTKL